MMSINESKQKKFIEVFRIFSILFWCAVVAFAIFGVLAMTVWKVPITSMQAVSKTLDTEWTWEREDGTSEKFYLPYELDSKKGESIDIYTTLPDDIDDNMYLLIWAGRNCKVYVNDELRASIDSGMKKYPGKSVKGIWLTVGLSAVDKGASLHISKVESGVYNGNNNVMYYGTFYGLFRTLWGKYRLSFCMAVVLLVIAMFIIIVGAMIYKAYNNKLSMLYFGYAIFVTAAWLVVDSDILQFITGNIFIDGVTGYFLCMLMPYVFVRYMNKIQNDRYVVIYSILSIVQFACMILFSFLHFTDINCFTNTQFYINLMMIITIFVIMALVIRDKMLGYMHEYRYIVIGICGLAIASVAEVLCVNLINGRIDGPILSIGLYFLTIMSLAYTMQELKEIERERMHAVNESTFKTNFLANMSHEIRTPINSILGMNEMILRENQDGSIAEYATNIEKSGKLLLNLINDILDITKIESGNTIITAECYNVSAMLSNMTGLLLERAKNKNLKTDVDVNINIPAVLEGDEINISRVVYNLITNAVKYTRKGTVAFKCDFERVDDNTVNLIFEVRDTGIGIKSESISKLFDAFYRTDARKNRNIEGTGLGLAIVKNLVELMHGALDVESEYGVGSTFRVLIPQKIVSIEAIGEKWLRLETTIDHPKYKPLFVAPNAKVLAVDDNQSNLLIIKQFLKRTRVRLEMLDNGNDAIEKCRNEKYDVILLDHMMPTPDGLETLKAIRNDESGLNRNTPAIILTANAIVGSRERYIKEGFNDYISKPIDAKMLERVVGNYVGNEEAEDLEENAANFEKTEVMEDNAADVADVANTADLTEGGADMVDVIRENTLTLETIEGLDYKQLYDNFAGDLDFVKEVIATVIDETRKKLTTLKQAYDNKDYKLYAVEAHGIKGIMASIYYNPLFVHAKEHEFAAKEGRYDYIDKDLSEFSKQCYDFVSLLEEVMNNQ